MPLDARWYCFFSPSREPPIKQTGTSQPLWSLSHIDLSPRSRAAPPIFGPPILCAWQEPGVSHKTPAISIEKKKKTSSKNVALALICCMRFDGTGSFDLTVVALSGIYFGVSRRGGCHGSTELSFCAWPGSWSYKRPKLGFVPVHCQRRSCGSQLGFRLSLEGLLGAASVGNRSWERGLHVSPAKQECCWSAFGPRCFVRQKYKCED